MLKDRDIILENNRIKLIPFEECLSQQLASISYDPDIWLYMTNQIKGPSDLEDYITQTLREKSEGISYPFLVIDKITNCVSGSTRYGFMDDENKTLEIGWTWYGKKSQGSGINNACKHALLTFAFEYLGCNRVSFLADEENLRSQRAIEKLGAKKEGTQRDLTIGHDGQCRNWVGYSILTDEWALLKHTAFSKQLDLSVT